MRIAVRFIYYKPVTPSMYILDLDDETWRKFLYGSNRKRIETVCSLRGTESLASYVRECAWIPLDGQNMLREIKTL